MAVTVLIITPSTAIATMYNSNSKNQRNHQTWSPNLMGRFQLRARMRTKTVASAITPKTQSLSSITKQLHECPRNYSSIQASSSSLRVLRQNKASLSPSSSSLIPPTNNSHYIHNERLEVKLSRIPGAGLGLFSTQGHAKGEIICEYEGEVFTLYEYIERTENGSSTGNYGVSIGAGRVLDAEHHVLSYGRYINDAAAGLGWIVTKDNNAEMIMTASEIIPNPEKDHDDEKMADDFYKFKNVNKRVLVKATRPIDAGEEILMSYGEGYWRATRVRAWHAFTLFLSTIF